MFKVIEDGKEYFYDHVEKVTTIVNLERDKQYIFIQEEGVIVIWKVIDKFGGTEDLDKAIRSLNNYYKKHHCRHLDSMQKKLLSL